jgi:hypothetical protein
VVLSVYVARAGAGIGVGEGVNVAVETGVAVAVGVSVSEGVTLGCGASTEQEESKYTHSRETGSLEGVLFRMGCILPLVVKITELFHEKIRMDHPICSVYKAPATKNPPAEGSQREGGLEKGVSSRSLF